MLCNGLVKQVICVLLAAFLHQVTIDAARFLFAAPGRLGSPRQRVLNLWRVLIGLQRYAASANARILNGDPLFTSLLVLAARFRVAELVQVRSGTILGLEPFARLRLAVGALGGRSSGRKGGRGSGLPLRNLRLRFLFASHLFSRGQAIQYFGLGCGRLFLRGMGGSLG